MRLIIRTLKQYITLNIHVSLALISLVAISYHYLGVAVDWYYVAFAFFLTLIAYTYIKNVPNGVALKMVMSNVITKSPWWIHLLCLVCFWMALSFQIQPLLILLVLVLLCLGYCLPRPTTSNKINNKNEYSELVQSSLRDYGAIKVIIVAIVWCGVSLLLPIKSLMIFDVTLGVICVAQFLWIIVLTIPFEIRDAHKDQLRHPTWPQKLGLRGTKILGVILWTLSLVLHYFAGRGAFGSGQWSFFDLPFGITMALTLFGLLWAKPNQSFWYSAFWIEAIPILWVTIIYLIS